MANPQSFFAGIDPADVAGLAWRESGISPARELEWVGRSLLLGEQPRWLQIRVTTDFSETAGTRLSVTLPLVPPPIRQPTGNPTSP